MSWNEKYKSHNAHGKKIDNVCHARSNMLLKCYCMIRKTIAKLLTKDNASILSILSGASRILALVFFDDGEPIKFFTIVHTLIPDNSRSIEKQRCRNKQLQQLLSDQQYLQLIFSVDSTADKHTSKWFYHTCVITSSLELHSMYFFSDDIHINGINSDKLITGVETPLKANLSICHNFIDRVWSFACLIIVSRTHVIKAQRKSPYRCIDTTVINAHKWTQFSCRISG